MATWFQGKEDGKCTKSVAEQATLPLDDDKYKKADAAHKHNPGLLDMADGLVSQILGFVCFVIAQAAVFIWKGSPPDQIDRLVFLHLEVAGLLVLRYKIKSRDSVCGISGMTMVMYAFVFALRALVPLMMILDGTVEYPTSEVTVGIFSFLLVLDILKAVFVTHASTYQSDKDILKAWYLIPACFALTLVIRPNFPWTWQYDYVWTFNLYMDVLALMPQVVMMSRGGGKIEAPIANFVAATCIAHCGDIVHSFICDTQVFEFNPFGFVLAVSMQLVHLLLCADFMYYYCKPNVEKSVGSSLVDEMTLPKEALPVVDEV